MKPHNKLRAMLLACLMAVLVGVRAKDEPAADDLFTGPVPRLHVEIPAESLKVLRGYKQVWRQERPERIDVRVTVREGGRVYTNVALHLKGSFSFQPVGRFMPGICGYLEFQPTLTQHAQMTSECR